MNPCLGSRAWVLQTPVLLFQDWVVIVFVGFFSDISHLKTWIYAKMFSIISTSGKILVLDSEILWRGKYIKSWSNWEIAEMGKFSVVSWYCLLRKRTPMVGKGVWDWSLIKLIVRNYLWSRGEDSGLGSNTASFYNRFLAVYYTYLLALYNLWR